MSDTNLESAGEPGLDVVIKAWLLFSESHNGPYKHRFNDGATEDEWEAAEAKLGRKLPESLSALYQFSNGMSVLGGHLDVLPLDTGNHMGLTTNSDFLRNYDWPIPDELVIFGGNGGDELFGIWAPREAPASAPAPIIMVGEIFEPGSFAICGTNLTRFLHAWSACGLLWAEQSRPALDALGFTRNDLDVERQGDEAFAACFEWADPGLPHIPPDPYPQQLTPEDIKKFVESMS